MPLAGATRLVAARQILASKKILHGRSINIKEVEQVEVMLHFPHFPIELARGYSIRRNNRETAATTSVPSVLMRYLLDIYSGPLIPPYRQARQLWQELDPSLYLSSGAGRPKFSATNVHPRTEMIYC